MDDRMVMHPKDIRIKTDSGEYLSGKEAIEYLETKRKVLVSEKLEAGDIVKIKEVDEPVIVSDKTIPPFTYGGYTKEEPDEMLLFNQYTVEKIISKKRG